MAAHIDLLPTLVDLCGLDFIAHKALDGKSLAPLLEGKTPSWAQQRTLIVDSQRWENLVKWRKTAVMQNKWRLVNKDELYNIDKDPGQTHDVSSKFPEVVSRLQARYNTFWQSLVDQGVNQRYAYIKVGTPFENPAVLNAMDMHTYSKQVPWEQRHVLKGRSAHGILKIEFATSGRYKISLRRYPRESGLSFNENVPAEQKKPGQIVDLRPASKQLNLVKAGLYVAGIKEIKPIKNQAGEVNFEVNIPAGKYDMQAILIDKQGRRYPAYYIYIEKL